MMTGLRARAGGPPVPAPGAAGALAAARAARARDSEAAGVATTARHDSPARVVP